LLPIEVSDKHYGNKGKETAILLAQRQEEMKSAWNFKKVKNLDF